MSNTILGKPHKSDPAVASASFYDVVIVGAGVSGAIIANELSQNGFRVLVLEAGPGHDLTIPGYEQYLSRFYAAASKDNNAPYPHNRNAPMPRSTDVHRLQSGTPDAAGYLVQNGPVALDSTYTRVVGGTTMHWEGKALRMLPEDFEMRTRFGRGLDWPLSYEQLAPYYRKAEFELGVSADVEEQAYHGIRFDPDYVYPMRGIPASYLDKTIARDLNGAEISLRGEKFTLTVRGTPQARNGVPNPRYDGGKGYVPVGAVSVEQVEQGERCQGNNNCTPICPVQAKYHAGKTLSKALATGRVDLVPQAVASKVDIDPSNGRVRHIEFKAYADPNSAHHTTGTARGRVFVLAANAVENARLMLASGLPGASNLVGRNLMDHPFLLTWGLMPEVTGTMRGTQSTSGIQDLRGGAFRRLQAAFAVSIHNDGWSWATGSPYTVLNDIVDRQNQFGRALRRRLVDQVSRQLQLAFMVELLPDQNNRVTVDARYTDPLGNLRPVISYGLSDYTLDGIAYSRQLSRQIFQRLGAEDHTTYDPLDYGYVTYKGEGYTVRGGNHWAGTHIMGTHSKDSVVDGTQRSWDHENLYLVGAGSMPTTGTSNTTLTLSALSFLTAEHILGELHRDRSSATIAAA
jgi:choline dehydrogenase-like flavoprotein